MICIYHSRDLDGFTSGAIVKRWHELSTSSKHLKLIGYDYGMPFPYHEISAGEKVIMVDVSLKMPDMFKLAKQIGSAKNFIWIDHHISAIKEYESFVSESEEHKNFLTPVLENGIAACEVSWKYLFKDQPMPEAIKLLGEYDTWRNSDEYRWNERILPFQFGMRLYCNSPETFETNVIGPGGMSVVNDIIASGKTVLKYQAMVNEAQCKKASFEMIFQGLRAICLNGGGFNSDVFKSVYDEKKHDIMMPFQFDGKQWTISLYSTKPYVDCSVIAKAQFGGGHKQAAGFQVKDIASIFPMISV